MNSLKKIGLKQLKRMTYLPSEQYVNFSYEYFTGKKLDLKNPEEFNAKIQWYKVYYRPKILNQLVDKYEVRKYVKEKIGEEYLNEIYGVYHKVSEVNFDKLPERFVIKAVHASSYNLIVKDKSKLNKKKVFKLFNRWLSKNQYYRTGQEWAYKDVIPKLVAEKILVQENQSSLIDYKFYCFSGKAKFVEIHLDRQLEHRRSFWDLDFNRLPVELKASKSIEDKGVEKPSNFEEMITLSEKLADNFPFVRVDFYSIKGESIFGEMTFYPNDGRKDFIPNKYNKIIGDFFELPKIPRNEPYISQY